MGGCRLASITRPGPFAGGAGDLSDRVHKSPTPFERQDPSSCLLQRTARVPQPLLQKKNHQRHQSDRKRKVTIANDTCRHCESCDRLFKAYRVCAQLGELPAHRIASHCARSLAHRLSLVNPILDLSLRQQQQNHDHLVSKQHPQTCSSPAP